MLLWHLIGIVTEGLREIKFINKRNKDMIPFEFYNLRKAGKDKYPVACNVKQMIEQLQKLPDDLPLRSETGEPVELVVYDVRMGKAVLQVNAAEVRSMGKPQGNF